MTNVSLNYLNNYRREIWFRRSQRRNPLWKCQHRAPSRISISCYNRKKKKHLLNISLPLIAGPGVPAVLLLSFDDVDCESSLFSLIWSHFVFLWCVREQAHVLFPLVRSEMENSFCTKLSTLISFVWKHRQLLDLMPRRTALVIWTFQDVWCASHFKRPLFSLSAVVFVRCVHAYKETLGDAARASGPEVCCFFTVPVLHRRPAHYVD